VAAKKSKHTNGFDSSFLNNSLISIGGHDYAPAPMSLNASAEPPMILGALGQMTATASRFYNSKQHNRFLSSNLYNPSQQKALLMLAQQQPSQFTAQKTAVNGFFGKSPAKAEGSPKDAWAQDSAIRATSNKLSTSSNFYQQAVHNKRIMIL